MCLSSQSFAPHAALQTEEYDRIRDPRLSRFFQKELQRPEGGFLLFRDGDHAAERAAGVEVLQEIDGRGESEEDTAPVRRRARGLRDTDLKASEGDLFRCGGGLGVRGSPEAVFPFEDVCDGGDEGRFAGASFVFSTSGGIS